MSVFPPDDVRCAAEKRDGLRCTRSGKPADNFPATLCGQHEVEVEIQRLFTGDAAKALAWVLDRKTRQERR